MDFTGLKEPYRYETQSVTFGYRPPVGKQVVSASVVSPEAESTQGELAITKRGDSLYEVTLDTTQLSVVDLTLADAAPPEVPADYAGPVFTNPDHAQAVDEALTFMRTQMRDNSLTAPWKYGVYTNLVEVETQDARYAHGHLVTSEHMGLMLRTTACLGDEQAFGEAYDFVSQTMVSPLFQVINWTVDPVRGTPFTTR